MNNTIKIMNYPYILSIYFLCTLAVFCDDNIEFDLYLSKFKIIEIPHTVTNNLMQKLLENYSYDDYLNENEIIDTNYVRKITASLLKMEPENLEVLPIYYPYGKYSINNLIFTIIFYIGNEYLDDDEETEMKSYAIKIWTFDKSGKFTDNTQIGKCFGSNNYYMECSILKNGDLEVTSTHISSDEKTRKQSINKITDKYKLDMDLKKFQRIKSKK
jgi:hypothetical protein